MHKHFIKEPIGLIHLLSNGSNVTFSLEKDTGSPRYGHLVHTSGSFTLTFANGVGAQRLPLKAGAYYNSSIFCNHIDLTGLIWINRVMFSFKEEENGGVFYADIPAIDTTSFLTDQGYYRVIMPLAKKIPFSEQLTATGYESDIWARSTESTFVHCDEKTFHILLVLPGDNCKEHFMVIDCDTKMDWDVFKNYANSIRNAFGYMTGYLAADYGYYFSYDNFTLEHFTGFRHVQFRQHIQSDYTPINSRHGAYDACANHVIDDQLLRSLSIKEFSRLCTLLYENPKMESVIVFMLESSKGSLLSMPSGYSIALEMIAPIIYEGQDDEIAVIPDKEVRALIRKEFKKIAAEYKDRLQYDILSNKIDMLHQATNADKLKKPFSYLNIQLTKEEFAIIKMRNDFLHGRSPVLKREQPCFGEDCEYLDLFHISLRFYTLLNLLILKKIGYTGLALNYAKLFDTECRMVLLESYYRSLE